MKAAKQFSWDWAKPFATCPVIFAASYRKVLARVNWQTDFFIFANTSMDTLDYTSGKVNEGSKAILMGLGEAVRDLPRDFRGELPQGVGAGELANGLLHLRKHFDGYARLHERQSE